MRRSKNLLEKDYLKESIYGSAEKVENIHQRYVNVISDFSKKDGSEMKYAAIKELKDLHTILLKQEQKFYTALGVSSPKEAVSKLEKEIQIWNSGGAETLLKAETTKEVFGIVVSTVETAQVMEIFQTYTEKYQGSLDKIITEAIEQAPVDSALNVKQIVHDFLSDKMSKPKDFTRKTSLAILRIEKTSPTSYRLVADKGELSNAVKADILDIISQDVDANGESSDIAKKASNLLLSQGVNEESISKLICEHLRKKIKNTSVYEKIAVEIKRGGRGNKPYARWGNYFVIQGYLGEVYWNAFMKNIFVNNRGIRATGNIKNFAGKSLSVDMIVRGIGFQIKHWSLKDTEGELTHQSDKTVKFGTFLNTGVEMLQSEVGQVVAQMFGSLSYNIAIKDGEYTSESSKFKEYEELRERMIDVEKASYDDLELLFQTKLHKIIGISGSGGIERIKKDEAFVKGKQYYNTFWAINDKIIPSSIIIAELIDAVKETKFTELVTFNIAGFVDKGNKYWPEKVDYSDLSMANRWTINYNTRFNLTKLLQKATQRV